MARRVDAHGETATDGRQVAAGRVGPLIERSLHGGKVALTAPQPVNDTLPDQRGDHVKRRNESRFANRPEKPATRVTVEMVGAFLQDIEQTDIVRIRPIREEPGRTAMFGLQVEQELRLMCTDPIAIPKFPKTKWVLRRAGKSAR